MNYLQEDAEGIRLTVYVQPKSSRNKLAGIHGDSIKLCITAPPVDGKANEAVIHFFAKLFHLPKSSISIVNGLQSRTKSLVLSGLSLETASAVLRKMLP